MDSIFVLIIGIIMTISGIGVFILGHRRRVPNTWLWALFPFIHGLHEFADYWLDLWEGLGKTVPFIVERFELFFAFASSFALLAAAVEYNGVISKPNGKIGSLIGLTFVSYVFFAFPEEAIEEVENYALFGSAVVEPFRFFFGFILVLLAAFAILGTYISLYFRAKEGEIGLDRQTSQANIVAVILLLIFAVFEGFDAQLSFYVVLRAVFLALFIIIPGYVVLVSKLGLQRILVIDNSGILVFGYNFTKDVCIFCDEADMKGLEESDDVLTAGFLAAITSYSGEVLKVGRTFSIKANRLYFVIASTEKKIYVLQSIDYDKNLERVFMKLVRDIQMDLETKEHSSEEITEKYVPIVKTAFAQFT